jgi:hypothetical protein
MSNTLVIYHAKCPDGIAAAWAAWMVYRPLGEYLPASYGDPPPAAGTPLAWDDMVTGLRARRVVILARLEEARALQVELNRINQVIAVDDLPQAAE